MARTAGWKAGEKGDGTRGQGIGFARYKTLATYVAVVAEVEIDRNSGRIRVPRAFAAADAGQIINPDGLKNQIEGGMIQRPAGPCTNPSAWTATASPRAIGAAILS